MTEAQASSVARPACEVGAGLEAELLGFESMLQYGVTVLQVVAYLAMPHTRCYLNIFNILYYYFENRVSMLH